MSKIEQFIVQEVNNYLNEENGIGLEEFLEQTGLENVVNVEAVSAKVPNTVSTRTWEPDETSQGFYVPVDFKYELSDGRQGMATIDVLVTVYVEPDSELTKSELDYLASGPEKFRPLVLDIGHYYGF